MVNQKEKSQATIVDEQGQDRPPPQDTRSLEAGIVALTKDPQLGRTHAETWKGQSPQIISAVNINQKKKMLDNLCKTNYDVFVKTCREPGVDAPFSSALCFQERKSLRRKKPTTTTKKTNLKAAAAATSKQEKQEEPRKPKSPSKV
jgi:hypothetical protein